MLSPWTSSPEAQEIAKLVSDNAADLGEAIDTAVGQILAEIGANRKDLAQTVANGKRFARKLIRQNTADLESSLGPAIAAVQGAVVENGIELAQAQQSALMGETSDGHGLLSQPSVGVPEGIGQIGAATGLVRQEIGEMGRSGPVVEKPEGQSALHGADGGRIGTGSRGTTGSQAQAQEITLAAGQGAQAIGTLLGDMIPGPCPEGTHGIQPVCIPDVPGSTGFCRTGCFWTKPPGGPWDFILQNLAYLSTIGPCTYEVSEGPAEFTGSKTIKVCCPSQIQLDSAWESLNLGLQVCKVIEAKPCDPTRLGVIGQCFFCACRPKDLPANCVVQQMPDGAFKVCCHQLDQMNLQEFWQLYKCGPFYSCDPNICKTECKPDCGACPVDCRKCPPSPPPPPPPPDSKCCPNLTCPPPVTNIENKLSCPPPVIEVKPTIIVNVTGGGGGGGNGGGGKPAPEPCLPEGDPDVTARYWFDQCYDQVRFVAMNYLGVSDFAGPAPLETLSANRFVPIDGDHAV